MKFSPQGNIYLAVRDAVTNLPGTFFTPGCADDLTLAFSQDKWEHQETCSGQHAVDAEGVKANKASLTTTLTEFKDKNVELFVHGTTNARASSTTAVAAETLPAAMAVGDVYFLGQLTGNPKTGITSLVVTDSTGSPLTLVLDTDYAADVASGGITILGLGSYVQPFKAAYSHQQDKYISMFTAGTAEYWMRFVALNTQNANKKSMVDLYRVRFDPTSKFDLLAPELSAFPLTGSVLIDPSKSASGALGQFGRVSIPV